MKTPLMFAVERGHYNIVKKLLSCNKVDVSLKCCEFGNTALHYACEALNLEIIKLLVNESNYSMIHNIKNKGGLTPQKLIESKICDLHEPNNTKKSKKLMQDSYNIQEYFINLETHADKRS